MVKGELEPGSCMRMIFDSEEHFPNSCVHYVRFSSYALRQMFAYLREKEFNLQDDLKRHKGTTKGEHVTIQLREVEAHLIWMAHNLTPWIGAEDHPEQNIQQLELKLA